MTVSTALPLIVAFGGGTNSTAMLCGFHERGFKPDLILFADTGGELPHTYSHLKEMDARCREWWGLGIEVVAQTYRGEVKTLEENCLRLHTLPSLACGRKACSRKYKTQPMNTRSSAWMVEHGHTNATKAIGYDAGEGHRSLHAKSETLSKGRVEHFWYPLVEWQWRRADCYAAIARHGLSQPGKSSCFFCPAMKRHEIVKLKEDHPDHFARAVAMESNLKVKGKVKGLSMGVPWTEIVAADDAQAKLFDWIGDHATPAAPCGCYDG